MIRWMGLCALLVTVLMSACGAEDQPLPGTAAEDGEPSDVSTEYEVVLANALSDTLRGSATFGRVFSPQTNRTQLVIRLRSSFDFAGGIVITRHSTDLPQEGTYELTGDSLNNASGDHFLIFYREGMLRDLQSYSGSLTFSSVSDSLIIGQFDAMLRGQISERSRVIEAGEVHAVGRFQAERGLSGYVIGI